MQAERPQLEFPAAEQPDSQRGGMYIDLQPPAEGQFILDKARVIDEATQEKIREICIDLLREKATPIIVVTIESMAAYGGAGLRIETFARLLFDQWGIGAPEINGQVWNTGMLLLVSVGDRKARIELGAHWKRDKDAQARQIMDELIIPRFREGDYAAGILAGVEGLSHIARDLALPSMPRPWWHYALIIGSGGAGHFHGRVVDSPRCQRLGLAVLGGRVCRGRLPAVPDGDQQWPLGRRVQRRFVRRRLLRWRRSNRQLVNNVANRKHTGDQGHRLNYATPTRRSKFKLFIPGE